MTSTKTVARRSWGWVLADGIIGIVIGLIALVDPGLTVIALAVLLGIGLLIQGGAQLATGVTAFPGTAGRGWTIFLGVLAVVAGLICLVDPGTGIVAIVIGVTIWFFAAGFNELAAAAMLSEHRGWNMTMGVLSIIAGIIVVARPGVALSAAAFVTGLLFLIRGAGETALAVQLRSGARGHRPAQPA